MRDVTVSTELDASPAEVWALIEPIERHVDWMADAVAIRFETDQTRGEGTRFACDTKIGPIALTDHMEITRWIPAGDPAEGAGGGRAEMGVRHSGWVTGEGLFVIEPLADGARSRFTWTESLELPWMLGGRLGAAIIGKLVLGPVWRRNLKALEGLVSEHRGSPAHRGSVTGGGDPE